MELAAPREAQHDLETGAPRPVETVLDSGIGNTPCAAALSIARPSLPQVPHIAEVATVNPRAPLSSTSTLSMVPIPVCLVVSQSHPIPVRADIHEGEKFGVINHSTLSEVT